LPRLPRREWIKALRNVLITAASRRVPLVKAFNRALAQLGWGRVVVTDVNPLSPAVYATERAFRVPISSDSRYIDEILTIALGAEVDVVIPSIDDELTVFAATRDRFRAAGVSVMVSPPETTILCNDKLSTCRELRRLGIPAADSYLPAELSASPTFPLFIKPRCGRGSVGAYPVRNARELSFFVDYVPDPVVQEYLDGPEFTIDVLCDFAGRPLSIVPRERVVVRAGVMDRGRTVKDERLIDLAMACARAIRFVGAINIQCRIVDHQPIIFEINPRFSGGIPLTIEAGADFPLMMLKVAAGCRVAPVIGRFRDNVWMTSYETSVFLDGDDTRLEPFSPDAVQEAPVAASSAGRGRTLRSAAVRARSS
jgi:carbamoyl-phosphate synthase large subunit